jgi:hypothetical protein
MELRLVALVFGLSENIFKHKKGAKFNIVSTKFVTSSSSSAPKQFTS